MDEKTIHNVAIATPHRTWAPIEFQIEYILNNRASLDDIKYYQFCTRCINGCMCGTYRTIGDNYNTKKHVCVEGKNRSQRIGISKNTFSIPLTPKL